MRKKSFRNVVGVPNQVCAHCYQCRPQSTMVRGIFNSEFTKEIWLCNEGQSFIDTCEGQYYSTIRDDKHYHYHQHLKYEQSLGLKFSI